MNIKNIHNKKEPIILNKNISSIPTRTSDPKISIVDQAKEIEKASEILTLKVNSKLEVILKQIKFLQEEAKKIINEAYQDIELHKVRCSFEKKPEEIIYLYKDDKKDLFFSRISPEEWGEMINYEYLGAYKMRIDRSFEKIDDN
ncbi:MAG TPA: DUF2452 domain-containing protein [Spirochaetota bacterium]|nr:DUF2452 domain-containing protein [Spirochaetota bacterium]HOM39225.1 DUF2452 domain-containing protein [Spirochaetota bacterium]HPP04216.1 DUF2452 domain-containing protein [Spirochaetota bacterium]